MSLAEKLQEIREIAKQRIPEETRARMQQATVELRNSGILNTVLREGERMPPFALPNSSGTLISSHDLLGKGNLVLSFYRGFW